MTFHVNMNILVVAYCRKDTVHVVIILLDQIMDKIVILNILGIRISDLRWIFDLHKFFRVSSSLRRVKTTIKSELKTPCNNFKVGLPQCEYYCGCFDTYHHCQTSFLRFDL